MMFAKFFQQEARLKVLLSLHSTSVQLNQAAQKRLMDACCKKETCPIVDRRKDPNRTTFRCIG